MERFVTNNFLLIRTLVPTNLFLEELVQEKLTFSMLYVRIGMTINALAKYKLLFYLKRVEKLEVMKQGQGTCSTFKAFNLTHLHVLRS